MLTIPIKKKWFDMILSGEKKEEYREIKPYWTKRFQNARLLDFGGLPTYKTVKVEFRNGYGLRVPSFVADVTLEIGKGAPLWGAKWDEIYYMLCIRNIEENDFDSWEESGAADAYADHQR